MSDYLCLGCEDYIREYGNDRGHSFNDYCEVCDSRQQFGRISTMSDHRIPDHYYESSFLDWIPFP